MGSRKPLKQLVLIPFQGYRVAFLLVNAFVVERMVDVVYTGRTTHAYLGPTSTIKDEDGRWHDNSNVRQFEKTRMCR